MKYFSKRVDISEMPSLKSFCDHVAIFARDHGIPLSKVRIEYGYYEDKLSHIVLTTEVSEWMK